MSLQSLILTLITYTFYIIKSNWDPSNVPSSRNSGQSIRAYHFWHHNEMTLDNMCDELSIRKKAGGLKPATVM